MHHQRCLSLLFCLIFTGVIHADGLLYKLPDDGTAATYTLKETSTFTGRTLNNEGSFTIASVGREKVNEEDCRWLEIVVRVKAGEKTGETVIKTLVPQQHLGEFKDPLNHWIRGWAKLELLKPNPLTREMLRTPTAVKINLFITAPLKEVEPLKENPISTKVFGDLVCKGTVGYHTLKDGVVIVNDGKVTKRDARLRFTNYVHAKAPFGVVRAEFQMDGGDDQARAEAI